MSSTARTIFLHYGGAVVVTALAVLIRFLLDPVVGDLPALGNPVRRCSVRRLARRLPARAARPWSSATSHASWRIREQFRGTGVVLVAITGWGQEEDRQRSKEAGIDFHVVKPVEPASVEKLLAARQPAER